MGFIARLFHRCNFNKRIAPMVYECKCGRKQWGLYEEKN